ncbi:hypothetical protein TNCV_536501 [Trichonephila clavipes]|nr:hypothetical protein TNCV_536501 [Trichonephila clavipes]
MSNLLPADAINSVLGTWAPLLKRVLFLIIFKTGSILKRLHKRMLLCLSQLSSEGQGHQCGDVYPEDRTLDARIRSRVTWPLDKSDLPCPEDTAGGLGSNPGEGMDVCKRIVPLWHECTLIRHKSYREVSGREIEAPDLLWCSPSKLGWNLAKSYYHPLGAQGYSQRQAYI